MLPCCCNLVDLCWVGLYDLEGLDYTVVVVVVVVVHTALALVSRRRPEVSVETAGTAVHTVQLREVTVYCLVYIVLTKQCLLCEVLFQCSLYRALGLSCFPGLQGGRNSDRSTGAGVGGGEQKEEEGSRSWGREVGEGGGEQE